MASESNIKSDLQLQDEYAQSMADAGFDYSAVVMGAVVKGMRDLGYKSMATALDEHVDNAVQAEATKVHVFLGGDGTPAQIGVIDNGHAMSPLMLRLSAVWGAGHHQNDRAGFGKYGYGMPSACVSIGKRFSVYSKLAGEDWHSVTVDLAQIEQGKFALGERVIVDEPVKAEPPTALKAYLEEHFPDGLDSGTIVWIDEVDRLTWKRTSTIKRHLLEHFGLIFRNYLRATEISVQGERVKPVDPLFLDPEGLAFNDDDERAVPLPSIKFGVKDPKTRDVLGEVRVRYASMPAGFGRVAVDKLKTKGGKTNARFPILDENNGIIVLRAGRQIDVVRTKRDKELGIDFSVNNDDRYWGVEIDFDPSLDEEFSITTSKQQVSLSDRMWQLLKEHNVMAAIQDLRNRYDDLTAAIKEKQRADDGTPSPSEKAMEESEGFVPMPGPARKAKGTKRIQEEAERRAKDAGVAPEEVMPKVEDEAEARYKVLSKDVPASAAFYEAEQFGGQTRVILNRHHGFYTRIYNGPKSTPESREALDLLLLTLAEAELNSDGDRELWYQSERAAWSQRLHVGVDRYEQIVGENKP